jgi:hypothetical protein
LPAFENKALTWCIVTTKDDVDVLSRVYDHAVEARLEEIRGKEPVGLARTVSD